MTIAVAAACSSDDEPAPASSPVGAAGAPATGVTTLQVNAQTPPVTGKDDIEAWLAKGDYKEWTCEKEPHNAKSPSPHGVNRVCSNLLVAQYKGQLADERPIGSASVKEIWDAAGEVIEGYAVEVKTQATSSGGASWYWYDRVAGNNVVADGFGDTGSAKSICVGCHIASGTDAEHITSEYSRDYIYTQVTQLECLNKYRNLLLGLRVT